MINADKPDMLKMWRANMDIQLIQSVYGVAGYICTYICKSEPQGLKLAITKAVDTLPEKTSLCHRFSCTIPSPNFSSRSSLLND